VIVAVWTLESDNGTGDMGKLPVIRTVATLAHDCRRSELFQRELIAALQIAQRGDLPLHDLIGAYAGEIGLGILIRNSVILIVQIENLKKAGRPSIACGRFC
jgi:membrane-bound lytic murein transglycosylase B